MTCAAFLAPTGHAETELVRRGQHADRREVRLRRLRSADTVAQLFGGSQQAFAAHEPADLLASGRYPHTGG